MKKGLILLTLLATLSFNAQADPNNDGMVLALNGSNVDPAILPVLKREEEQKEPMMFDEVFEEKPVPTPQPKTLVVGEEVID